MARIEIDAPILANPPAQLDLPLTEVQHETSVTTPELLELPLVNYNATCSPHRELEDRLRILHTIVPQRFRTRLILRRISDPVDLVYHFSMERDEPIQPWFLLSARKRSHNGSTYFDFWADPCVHNLRHVHKSYVGYAQGNPFDTATTIYVDSAERHGKDDLRQEVATVMYTPDVVNGELRSWSGLTVLLPGLASEKPGDLKPTTYQPAKVRDHLLSRWSRRREPGQNLGDLLLLENRTALWNQDSLKYALDTAAQSDKVDCVGSLDVVLGAVPVTPSPTPKNATVPVVNDDKPAELHLVRTNEDTVQIDLTFPLTAYTAASLAMTLMDGKAASNYVKYSPDRMQQRSLEDAVIGELVAANS